jgi:hypothetical protein
MRVAPIGLALLAAAAIVAVGAVAGRSDATPRLGGTAAAPSLALSGAVIPPFRPDARTIGGCRGDAACVQQGYGNLAFRSGPGVAIASLSRDIARNGPLRSQCHRVAHAIGAATILRWHGRVGSALAAGDALCASGYYHGVLERSLAGVPDTRLGAAVRGICDERGALRLAFLRFQCLHGIGHGLMIRTGYDLPRALAACRGMATDWDRTSCSGGAFMENVSSSYGVTSRYLRRDDLTYPCPVVRELFKDACYLIVTARILPMVGYRWPAAARVCRGAEPRWASTCMQSLGRDAAGFNDFRPARVRRICGGLGADVQEPCLIGAARAMVNEARNGLGAARLCGGAPSVIRPDCFRAVGAGLAPLRDTPAGRGAACRRITDAHLADCLRGAGVTT